MKVLSIVIACICIPTALVASSAAAPLGPLAEWTFDADEGNVARDSSGHAHHGKMHGATRVKQGSGWAISLDGIDDYIDCGQIKSPNVNGATTLETWVKPLHKARGMSCLLGDSLTSYLLTYYNTEVCDLYIGDGGNSVRGKLQLGQWNHVVASFDGKLLKMWINGRPTGTRESSHSDYTSPSQFIIGTRGQPDLPRFKGLLDQIRVYDRALSGEESLAHFRSEASDHDYDPTWFSRVKVQPYYYFDRGEIVIEANYKGLLPLSDSAQIEAKLYRKDNDKVSEEVAVGSLSTDGIADLKLPCRQLASGAYEVRVTLKNGATEYPVERFAFEHPPQPRSVPAPSAKVVVPEATKPQSMQLDVQVTAGGGFRVSHNGASRSFETRVSWPNGNFNHLNVGSRPYAKGEKNWKLRVRHLGKGQHEIRAGGDYYTILRALEVHPTHIQIKDTFTNTTNEDLGLLIYNDMLMKPGQLTGSWISGHQRVGRRPELNFPDYNPNVFVTDANGGVGIVPLDDVFVVQSLTYAEQQAAGVGTEKFALPPGKSYTLEWAVYPTPSGDYYDFVNTFRQVEDRIGTVNDPPGFITYGPLNRRQVPEKDAVEKQGIKVGIIHCLSGSADDPAISVEGIEFMDFPKEMQLLKQQAAATHAKIPGFKIVFHIAHSLYATNNPNRFADSKVILADGKQALWSAGEPYFSKQRSSEGWNWWIFYPTPGNSFHDALMKSVDVMMDDLGMDGVFMDGFFAAYSGEWSYDTDLRWDQHSAEIDPQTKTIRRKMNSVLLLSQPSMIEFSRKIRDKGGVVIANNSVFTRTIAGEKYIIFDNECASGPEMHFSPISTALAAPPMKTEKDVYLDILDKLSWGELFLHYATASMEFDHRSLAALEYPMTFEEIRPGMVRGKERIVTMNSGTYGWPGDHRLHLIHKYDGRGVPVGHDYVTTADSKGVWSELKFGEHEAAVIEPIPVTLDTDAAINAQVEAYDASAFRMLANGQAQVQLKLRSGLFPISAGSAYRVTTDVETTVVADKDGTLPVPLKARGPLRVVIEPSDKM